MAKSVWHSLRSNAQILILQSRLHTSLTWSPEQPTILSRSQHPNIQNTNLCHKARSIIDFKCQSWTETLARQYGSGKSKYPPLNEEELEEKFTRGGGPGGQATNTTSNCVLLKHLPTGLIVKCHAERSLETNRKIARRRMMERLDDHFNGEDSVKAKEKLAAKVKLLKKKAKTKKKLERLAAEREEKLIKAHQGIDLPEEADSLVTGEDKDNETETNTGFDEGKGRS